MRKTAIIILIFALPSVMLLYNYINVINDSLNTISAENAGVEYSQRLNTLLKDMQQHRGIANAYQSGVTSFKDELASKEAALNDDIEAINTLDNTYGTLLQTTAGWNDIKERWQQQLAVYMKMPAKEGFDAHTAIINTIISLTRHIADTSGMNHDAHAASAYLLTAMESLPRAAEFAGQIRGLGAGGIAAGNLSSQEKVHISSLASQFRSNMSEAETSLNKAFQKNQNLAKTMETSLDGTASSAYIAMDMLVRNVIYTDSIQIDPKEYFKKFTTAIDTNFDLHAMIVKSVQGLLKDRADKLKKKKTQALLGTIAVFLIGIYFAAASATATVQALSGLTEGCRRITKGDFSTLLPIISEDEAAEAAKSFNELSEKLSAKENTPEKD